MKYEILDTNESVTEQELREKLYRFEIQDLIANTQEYFKGVYDIKAQFKCIEKAMNGNIEEIIDILGTYWGVPVKEIKENNNEQSNING